MEQSPRLVSTALRAPANSKAGKSLLTGDGNANKHTWLNAAQTTPFTLAPNYRDAQRCRPGLLRLGLACPQSLSGHGCVR